MNDFKSGTYSITPKFLRRRRAAIGLSVKTLNIIESLFGYQKNLSARPSQATIACECDTTDDTVGWHLRYLRAFGYLSWTPRRMPNGTVCNQYDLSALRDFNNRLADAVKAEQPLPMMFTKSFTEWRDEERAKQKGGKRGSRKQSPGAQNSASQSSEPQATQQAVRANPDNAVAAAAFAFEDEITRAVEQARISIAQAKNPHAGTVESATMQARQPEISSSASTPQHPSEETWGVPLMPNLRVNDGQGNMVRTVEDILASDEVREIMEGLRRSEAEAAARKADLAANPEKRAAVDAYIRSVESRNARLGYDAPVTHSPYIQTLISRTQQEE